MPSGLICAYLSPFSLFEFLSLSLIYLPFCALRYVSSIIYNSYRILHMLRSEIAMA